MVRSVKLPGTHVQSFVGEIKPVALAIGLAFGVGVGGVPAASAGTITVNNLSGTSVGGQCTLRDAIQAANTDAAVQGCAAGSGTDTINFSVTGTISLATEIGISSNMTINGPGAANLTLAPSSTNRSLNISGGVPTVTISGLTFLGNGTANADGAAIYLKGSAGLSSLTVQNSVFTGNVTVGDGGALFLYQGGAMTIQSSTFTGNQAKSGRGGAIKFYNTGAVSITDSTFSGNQSDRGGAIFLYKSGPLTMSGTTLTGNVAVFAGGALFHYKTLGSSVISDSTISGNSTTGNGGGGGVFVYSIANPTTITNSTLTGNSTAGTGGAIHQNQGSVLNLVSSIVANSTDSTGTGDLGRSGATASTLNADHSLIQNAGALINGTSTANVLGQNPQLGPLASNGGPTQTHALLGGSPAIDTGSNPSALAFDQRGTPFVRSSGLTDIGAFEFQAGPPPPPTSVVPVPTLSQLGLALLGVLMAGWAMLTGFGGRRRQ